MIKLFKRVDRYYANINEYIELTPTSLKRFNRALIEGKPVFQHNNGEWMFFKLGKLTYAGKID